MRESRSVVASGQGYGEGFKRKWAQGSFFRIRELFSILILVEVTRLYTITETHQTVHFKLVIILCINRTLINGNMAKQNPQANIAE